MNNILCSNCGAEYDLDKDDISADLKYPGCGYDLRISGTKLVKKI